MCITFFKLDPLAAFPFVLAFNRDEMTTRQSVPATFQTGERSSILCGIDPSTDSTWLAFNQDTGNVCFLTNFRTPANYNQASKKYSSRGHLVMDWAIFDPHKTTSGGTQKYPTVDAYEHMLTTMETRGFNIVYGNVREGWLKYYQH